MPATTNTVDDEALTTRYCTQWMQPVEVGDAMRSVPPLFSRPLVRQHNLSQRSAMSLDLHMTDGNLDAVAWTTMAKQRSSKAPS